MSHSLGFGVKSMGKKAVPIEGVGAAKCDFVGMDAPRPSRKELSGVDELPKSGNMSADMDAALRKLENRRAAAAIHQHQPQAPHSKPEQNQRQYDDAQDNSSREAKRPSQNKTQGLMAGVHDDPETAATRREKLDAKRAEFLDRADLDAFESSDAEALRALVEKDGGMLVMDSSASSAKSRHTSADNARNTSATLADVPVSKPPKALAPQVLSSLQANEAPEKPVFVKRDKRETAAGPTDSSKRSAEAAFGSISSKKPLCSFDDE